MSVGQLGRSGRSDSAESGNSNLLVRALPECAGRACPRAAIRSEVLNLPFAPLHRKRLPAPAL